MIRLRVQNIGEDMTENLPADGIEQFVLGFKMGIKCAASDIGFVNDLLYFDMAIFFFLE